MRKIETLTYVNELGESVVFSYDSVFCPQRIDGLSNVQSTVYAINSMGQSGDTFVSSRIESRDIDISGVIRERDPDAMRLRRRELARVMNPQLSATLIYRYGDFVRTIKCHSVNTPSISKPPKAIYPSFSVQLVCPNPFWQEDAVHNSEIAAWIGTLEYPVEIPALTGDGKGGMEFGYRMLSLIVDVVNHGDVETGMKVYFSAMDTVKNPSIISLTSGEKIRLNITMTEGDMLTVSTGYGEKWAKLMHHGVETDALRYIDVDSAFIQLQPGENLMRYDADEGLNNLEVTIHHSNLYLGV